MCSWEEQVVVDLMLGVFLGSWEEQVVVDLMLGVFLGRTSCSRPHAWCVLGKNKL